MTNAYPLYAAPRRTGRVQLSRGGTFTLCGWAISGGWKPLSQWSGYVCRACRYAAARLAAEAAQEPTP